MNHIYTLLCISTPGKVRHKKRERQRKRTRKNRGGGRQFQGEGPIDVKDLNWTIVIIKRGRKRSWRLEERRGWRGSREGVRTIRRWTIRRDNLLRTIRRKI